MSTDLLLKITKGNTPIGKGDLQQLSAAEEKYVAFLCGIELNSYRDASDDVGVPVKGADGAAGQYSIGAYQDSKYNEDVGTHPQSSISHTTTTTYLNAGGVAVDDDYPPTSGTGDGTGHRPMVWGEYDGKLGLHEIRDDDLNTVADRMNGLIAQHDLAGVYRLDSAGFDPTETNWKKIEVGTSGTVTQKKLFARDNRTDDTYVDYHIYQKKALITDIPAGATEVGIPAIDRSITDTVAFKELQNVETAFTIGKRCKFRRGTQGNVGTYQLRSNSQGAPSVAGQTWVAKGSALDTRNDVGDIDHIKPRTSNYTRFRTSAYAGNYQGAYNRMFAGNYTGNYARPYTGDYTRDFVSNYTRSFEGNYQGNFAGQYTGDYTGSTIHNFTGDFQRLFGGNYIGDFNRPFVGNYASTNIYNSVRYRSEDFSGNYTGSTFTRSYAGNYIGVPYTGNFHGDFAGNYQGTYTGDYTMTRTTERSSATSARNFTRERQTPDTRTRTSITSTRQREKDYTGDYNRTVTRTRVTGSTLYYQGNYTGDFNRHYSGNYQGNFSQTFTGNYTSITRVTPSTASYQGPTKYVNNYSRTFTATSSRYGWFSRFDLNPAGYYTGDYSAYYVGEGFTSYNAGNVHAPWYTGVWWYYTRGPTIRRNQLHGGNPTERHVERVALFHGYPQPYPPYYSHSYVNEAVQRNYNAPTYHGNFQRDFVDGYTRTRVNVDTRTRTVSTEVTSTRTRALGYVGDFIGDYSDVELKVRSVFFAGNYTRNYAGNYIGDFGGNYTANYSRNFEGNFNREYSGGYTGAYTRDRNRTRIDSTSVTSTRVSTREGISIGTYQGNFADYFAGDFQRIKAKTYTGSIEYTDTRTRTSTRQQVFAGNYIYDSVLAGGYHGTYTAVSILSYVTHRESTRVSTYLRPLGTYTGDFSRITNRERFEYYTGTYVGDYNRDFGQTSTSTFIGNYIGSTILTGYNTHATYTLYVRTS